MGFWNSLWNGVKSVGGAILGNVGSIAGAGAAIYDTKQNNDAYLKGIDKTNQANLDLATQQNQWNLEQWNRQNDYNSPIAQMERFKAAGINPIFAAGDSGQAASLESADLANQQVPGKLETYIPQISSMLQLDQQLKLGAQQVKHQEIQNDRDTLSLELDRLMQGLNRDGSQPPVASVSVNGHQFSDEPLYNTKEYGNWYLRKMRSEAEGQEVDVDIARKNYELLVDTYPYLKELKQEQLEDLRETIKNKKADTTKKEWENVLREQFNINPDSDFGTNLLNLLLRDPSGVTNVINRLIESVKATGNGIVDKVKSSFLSQMYNSTKPNMQHLGSEDQTSSWLNPMFG